MLRLSSRQTLTLNHLIWFFFQFYAWKMRRCWHNREEIARQSRRIETSTSILSTTIKAILFHYKYSWGNDVDGVCHRYQRIDDANLRTSVLKALNWIEIQLHYFIFNRTNLSYIEEINSTCQRTASFPYSLSTSRRCRLSCERRDSCAHTFDK